MNFTIQDLTVITGLTRGQIDQTISRHGFKPTHYSVLLGQRRPFTRPDAVALAVAAALRELQIDWKFIAEVLRFSVLAPDMRGIIDVDFPPADGTVHGEEPVYILIHSSRTSATGITVFMDGEPIRRPGAEIVTFRQIGEWVAKGRMCGQCIIVDLTAILRRIDQFASSKGAPDASDE